MLNTRIMVTHYSTGLLFSDEARAQIVKPDLEQIPKARILAGNTPR